MSTQKPTYVELKKVKVDVADLEIGMFISELDRPWEGTTFLTQGITINDKDDVDSVKTQCKFVYIDFRDQVQYKQHRLKSSIAKKYKEQALKKRRSKNFDITKHAKPALKCRNKMSNEVKTTFEKVMRGEKFEMYQVKNTVKELVRNVLQNEQAMLMMMMLSKMSDRNAEHSLNVSILAVGLASFLGYSMNDLEEIGNAALLHDIGKIKIDKNILNKEGRITPQEGAMLCNHVEYGYQLLQKNNDISSLVIEVVRNHHERLSGTGYPRQLKGKEISQIVRIISIVDAFEDMTSDQPYRKPISIVEAYKRLLGCKGRDYDQNLVSKFIEWRGIYPPGTIVEMQTGEVGIVVATNNDFKLKPKVLLVLDEDKVERRQRLVDLRNPHSDESTPYIIMRAFETEAFGLNVQKYIEQGVIISHVR